MVYKLYFSIVLVITIAVVLFGLVFPYLISSENTELVVIGMISIVLTIPTLFFVIKTIIKNLMKGFKKDEKN